MVNIILKVENLTKQFDIKKKLPGWKNFIKNFFFPQVESIDAVKNLSFQVKRGEKVAFIGPNGAGKSTTIKMLTGILYPTSGLIEVLGLVPWKNRQELGFKIGTVFGQKSQLWTHLQPLDTFQLLSKIYEIEPSLYKKRLKELISLFEIAPFIHQPVKQLSLGERMRCEITASLLHNPDILFLDEPTIGLDINAKLMIRNLLNRLSKEEETTLFLTSHDTADIEQVCERVVVIDKGILINDSSIKDLKNSYSKKKVISLIIEEKFLFTQILGLEILEQTPYHIMGEVNLEVSSLEKVILEIFKLSNIKDITIENPSMEEIIREIYAIKA